MEIEFWGVRGSVPSPGPDTYQFGGNTPCVEVRCESEPVIVLDAGTGIRKLGDELVADKSVNDISLFLSHTHWDHIQGLPFFSALFSARFKIDIYGPLNYSSKLKDILARQMDHTYFPVRVEELAAKITFRDIGECVVKVGQEITIRTKFLNHPVVCLGYRVEFKEKSFTYLTDHEPYHYYSHMNLSISSPPLERRAKMDEETKKLINFIEGSDLLCIDGQYTPQEYKSRIGWGHSSVDDSYDLASMGRVKQMALFHHEPDRSDSDLQRILYYLQDRAWKPNTETVPIRLAKERQIIKL